MFTRIADEGSLDAKLVLIGDAPGRNEMHQGRPLVGAGGNKLEWWWKRVGLRRPDFYITNVLSYMPTNIERVSRDEMEAAFEALWDRLRKLTGPAILCPTGNYSLYAITGKGKISWHKKDGRVERAGIGDWRGSILEVELNGNIVRVIPTEYPTKVLGMPRLEKRCRLDWQRIADEFRNPQPLPEYDNNIKPTLEDLEIFVQDALVNAEVLSVDIETPRGVVHEVAVVTGYREKKLKTKVKQEPILAWEEGVKRDDPRVFRFASGKKKGQPKVRSKRGVAYLGCIGFAYDSKWSWTIPLTLQYWKTQKALRRAKQLVGVLLASRIPKVMQNGMFDSSWLRREGYVVNNWIWDTRAMHHALDPRDDHDLAYMASIYTRQPFWKHEAKDPDSVTKYASNSEALWTYNGIDVCVTLDLFWKLKAELEQQGRLAFYLQHYAALMQPLLDMTMYGIAVDRERMERERAKLEIEAWKIGQQLEAEAGLPLVGDSGGLSNDRVMFYLYGANAFPGEAGKKKIDKLQKQFPTVVPLRLPVQRKRRAKDKDPTATVDEVTIRRLILRFPTQLKTTGPLLLALRRCTKMIEFLDPSKCDDDERMRCQFSFITEAGRLSSQENAWEKGRNLQNIDRELRYVFVPDRRAS